MVERKNEGVSPDTTSAATAAHPDVGGARAWLTLIVLTAISAVSMLDRQIITVLAVDIKADLGLNNAEIGLIYGTFFAVFYSLFAIPLGKLADSWIRTKQVAGAISVWSIATIGCGLAGSFATMSLWRSVVAAGEAGSGPASNSVIADIFPRTLRGTAFAILMSATQVGLGLSLIFGGVIVGWWLWMFPSGIGWFGLPAWRATFILAAVPGLALGLIILLIREPRRGLADGLETPPVAHPIRISLREFLPLLPLINLVHAVKTKGKRSGDVKVLSIALLGGLTFIALGTSLLSSISPEGSTVVYGYVAGVPVSGHLVQLSVLVLGVYAGFSWILSQRRLDPAGFSTMWASPTYKCLLVIASGQLCIAYGFNGFAAPFAIETYGVGPDVVGPRLGVVTITCGIVGTLVGGIAGDWATRRHEGGRFFVMIASILAAPPLAFLALIQTDLASFSMAYGAFIFAMTAWYPCCTAMVADIMPPRMRGLATAAMYLAFTILGLGIGPYVVGFISDATGSLAIAMASIFVVAVAPLFASVMGLRSFPRARPQPQ